MSTDQPSNAPEDLVPRDGDTAARVLHDDSLDRRPGGGGLGGASAADPLGGSARVAGSASPNSPIDAVVPADGSGDDARAEAEARVLASRADAPEPHPGSY